MNHRKRATSPRKSTGRRPNMNEAKAAPVTNDPTTRDTCGSSDMPLLTPEVPSLGGPTAASPNPDLRIEAPPVLKLFGEGDTCDQARNKSEGNPASMNSDSSNGIGAASSTNARELDQLNADNDGINLQEVQQTGKVLNTIFFCNNK